ncbi:hypothetical protein ACFCXA_01485 [Streptomyces virginiae]|uniref:LmrA/YxaF family transcription factor n=1 Tax=Streptomyces virginiae TaxID=1961 RepID=UPI0035E24CEB
MQLAAELGRSGWTDDCPVRAAALETLGTDSAIQRPCVEPLRDWTGPVRCRA